MMYLVYALRLVTILKNLNWVKLRLILPTFMVTNNMLAMHVRHSVALIICITIALVSLFLALSFGAADTSIQDVFNSFIY